MTGFFSQICILFLLLQVFKKILFFVRLVFFCVSLSCDEITLQVETCKTVKGQKKNAYLNLGVHDRILSFQWLIVADFGAKSWTDMMLTFYDRELPKAETQSADLLSAAASRFHHSWLSPSISSHPSTPLLFFCLTTIHPWILESLAAPSPTSCLCFIHFLASAHVSNHLKNVSLTSNFTTSALTAGWSFFMETLTFYTRS